MRKEYEQICREVCQIYSFDGIPQSEIDGYYGVACVIAFKNGAEPYIEDMSRALDVDNRCIARPLHRLNVKGVFTKRYDLKNDNATSGSSLFKSYRYRKNGQVSEIDFSPEDAAKNAFCILAGIAGGLT